MSSQLYVYCSQQGERDYIGFTSDLHFPLFNPLICGQLGAEIRFLFFFHGQMFCLCRGGS